MGCTYSYCHRNEVETKLSLRVWLQLVWQCSGEAGRDTARCWGRVNRHWICDALMLCWEEKRQRWELQGSYTVGFTILKRRCKEPGAVITWFLWSNHANVMWEEFYFLRNRHWCWKPPCFHSKSWILVVRSLSLHYDQLELTLQQWANWHTQFCWQVSCHCFG